ncbi:MAG: hypothetical protein E7813_08355 [Bradyrhizobium sp.]|uniref:hypothetical protein n=1 Tax=Bradyrhizobium sp. TaxID=376 RepID=UPI0011F85F66|nr:hypothetical protein [Bradyrhizobium sp.]THD70428.1 MAG: hypothetical protein E7813_08355 [Bradyrhizobium sp.]
MDRVIQWMLANKDLITSWTAIFAVLASAVSFTIAAINMMMQRKHNRKSVLPIGHISVGDYENQIFVRIWNYGIGPMLIKRVVVAGEGGVKQEAAIIDLMPKLPGEYHWSTFVGNISDRTIPAADHISLILLEGDEDNGEFVAAREMVRRALSRLTVTVEYKDVYGNNMPAAIRNLEWFGRHWAQDS